MHKKKTSNNLMMNMTNITTLKNAFVKGLILAMVLSLFTIANVAQAAGLDELVNTMTRLKVGTAADHVLTVDLPTGTTFDATDIMVMPYRDGVSFRRGTLMAILANGRPLITSDPILPIPELVHGENVWLTPIDDHNAFKEAIEILAEQSSLREMLGEGAAKLSESFSWDKIAKQTATFYKEIINLES